MCWIVPGPSNFCGVVQYLLSLLLKVTIAALASGLQSWINSMSQDSGFCWKGALPKATSESCLWGQKDRRAPHRNDFSWGLAKSQASSADSGLQTANTPIICLSQIRYQRRLCTRRKSTLCVRWKGFNDCWNIRQACMNGNPSLGVANISYLFRSPTLTVEISKQDIQINNMNQYISYINHVNMPRTSQNNNLYAQSYARLVNSELPSISTLITISINYK